MLANAAAAFGGENSKTQGPINTHLNTDSISNDLALVQEVTPRQMGPLTFRERENESLLMTPLASEKKTSSMLSDDDISQASNFEPTRVSTISQSGRKRHNATRSSMAALSTTA